MFQQRYRHTSDNPPLSPFSKFFSCRYVLYAFWQLSIISRTYWNGTKQNVNGKKGEDIGEKLVCTVYSTPKAVHFGYSYRNLPNIYHCCAATRCSDRQVKLAQTSLRNPSQIWDILPRRKSYFVSINSSEYQGLRWKTYLTVWGSEQFIHS